MRGAERRAGGSGVSGAPSRATNGYQTRAFGDAAAARCELVLARSLHRSRSCATAPPVRPRRGDAARTIVEAAGGDRCKGVLALGDPNRIGRLARDLGLRGIFRRAAASRHKLLTRRRLRRGVPVPWFVRSASKRRSCSRFSGVVKPRLSAPRRHRATMPRARARRNRVRLLRLERWRVMRDAATRVVVKASAGTRYALEGLLNGRSDAALFDKTDTLDGPLSSREYVTTVGSMRRVETAGAKRRTRSACDKGRLTRRRVNETGLVLEGAARPSGVSAPVRSLSGRGTAARFVARGPSAAHALGRTPRIRAQGCASGVMMSDPGRGIFRRVEGSKRRAASHIVDVRITRPRADHVPPEGRAIWVHLARAETRGEVERARGRVTRGLAAYRESDDGGGRSPEAA